MEVKDPGAPVDFFMNGQNVVAGEGRHQLVVHNIKMEDIMAEENMVIFHLPLPQPHSN